MKCKFDLIGVQEVVAKLLTRNNWASGGEESKYWGTECNSLVSKRIGPTRPANIGWWVVAGLNANVRWLYPATCQTQPRPAATGSATTIWFKTPTLSLHQYIYALSLYLRQYIHTLSRIITMNDDETESEGEIRASVEIASEDAPSSPGSSGYIGEGGSTSATTGSQFGIEHEEIEEDTTIGMDRISISDSHTSWIAGKRHFDEVCALV